MGKLTWLAAPALILSLALAGCGDSEIDTAELKDSISSADSANKATVDDVVAAVEAGDFKKAGSALSKLASRAKLTSEQKKAIKNTVSQIRDQITQIAKDAAEEGKKAVNDLKDRLTK